MYLAYVMQVLERLCNVSPEKRPTSVNIWTYNFMTELLIVQMLDSEKSH